MPETLQLDQLGEVRKQLVANLKGAQAHAGFDVVVKDFPLHLRGTVAPGAPYSAWQLLEHIRIAQQDILNFSAPPTGGYQPLEWPNEYWPTSPEPPSSSSWDQTVSAIRGDRDRLQTLIESPETDLFRPFRWGTGQNLLREALLAADHTSHHLGELIVIRRLLGVWH